MDSTYIQHCMNIPPSPDQLKCLSEEELYALAKDIRLKIIETVSKQGGHLSSNLGVVELSIALLKCFDPLKDDILFDVGHQSYPFKLLTDRWEKFSTLRQENGISGFPDPRESPYDKFISGHSSTALAIGAGFAIEKQYNQKSNHSHTIVVFGDGSITGGESFESLNAIGHLQLPIIAILNDNKMSISPNVGALATSFTRSFTRFRKSKTCKKLKKTYHQQLKQWGKWGKTIELIGEKAKSLVKQVLFPEMFFEELGFFYMGPVDGHHIKECCNMLLQAKEINQPVLIHAYTQKGKGFLHAESNPVLFHSSPPFVVEKQNCKTHASSTSFSKVFGEALVEAKTQHQKLYALTAAMTDGLGLKSFSQEHSCHFFDFGIAEQHMVSCAAGMAHKGLKPVVGIYSTFLQRALDQIIHDCAILKEPVVFAIDRAGAVSDDGPTHQGIFDLSFLLPVPNAVIMAPSSALELKAMLLWSLEQDQGPIFIRYPKDSAPRHPLTSPVVKGKALTIKEGHDVTIIFLGPFQKMVEEIATILSQQNHSVGLVNARFAKPLDEECILHCASSSKLLVTIEDGVIQGGFGNTILSLLHQKKYQSAQMLSMGLPSDFPGTMKRNKILEKAGISPENISKKIIERLVQLKTT